MKLTAESKIVLDAVCAGFDKAIAGDREKLKEVQNKRDKAKLAGVKERIAAETAHIHKENEALKNQVKDAFAQENIPMFCNSRIYIALLQNKRMTNVIDLPVVYRISICGSSFFVKRNTTVSVVGNDFVLCCSNFNPVLYQ